MTTATLSSKGQITLPKKVREALRVERGDRLELTLRDDGVVEMRPRTLDLMDLCGILKPEVRGVSVEDMNEAIRQEAGRDASELE